MKANIPPKTISPLKLTEAELVKLYREYSDFYRNQKIQSPPPPRHGRRVIGVRP